jgi:YVTN family beta-propeller protein
MPELKINSWPLGMAVKADEAPRRHPRRRAQGTAEERHGRSHLRPPRHHLPSAHPLIPMSLTAQPARRLRLLPGAAFAAPFAYVPNEKSATVSVIDTATDTVVRTLPGGQRPRGIATDGKHLSSARPRNSLVIIDITAEAHPPHRLGESPEGVSVSADQADRRGGGGIQQRGAAGCRQRRKLAEIKVRGKNPSTRCSAPTAAGCW